MKELTITRARIGNLVKLPKMERRLRIEYEILDLALGASSPKSSLCEDKIGGLGGRRRPRACPTIYPV